MEGFFQQVYQIVAQIPKGKVATYGQIAALIGHPRSARIVGWAMQAAPDHLQLPCHRVVNHQGGLADKSGFGPMQHAALLAEGIAFTMNGCVDLKKHLWKVESRTFS